MQALERPLFCPFSVLVPFSVLRPLFCPNKGYGEDIFFFAINNWEGTDGSILSLEAIILKLAGMVNIAENMSEINSGTMFCPASIIATRLPFPSSLDSAVSQQGRSDSQTNIA